MSEQFPLSEQWKILQEVASDFDKFGPLYVHYYPRIYRFVYVRVSDKDVAEDLTSHVFLKMTEKLQKRKWDSMKAFVKYLYLIARSTLKNYYRDHKNVLPLDMERGERDSDKTLLDLNEIYSKLKKDEKELIYLHYFMGYSFEEISVMEGKKSSSIRMKHKRLLEKMKYLL